MIARVVVLGLLLISGLLLDTVVLQAIEIAGVSPSVVVLIVVAVGLTDGAESGARFGFSAGLVVDLLSGGLVGLHALVFLLVGFASGLSRPFLTGSALVSQVALGGVGGATAILVYGGLSLLFDPQGLTVGSVLTGAIVAGLLSALLAPPVLRVAAAALQKVDPAAIGA